MMPSPLSARHADRRGFLLGRARIIAALRQLFAAQDFIEVDTSTLVASPGNETHLHAFSTELVTPAASRERLYLRTSPEFACKKLLAAGEPRIVEFARSYRNRERGALHHPEFTLVEWYRTRAPYEQLMDDCAAVLVRAAEAVGTRRFTFRERAVDPFAAPERLTGRGGICPLCRHRPYGRAAAGAAGALCRGRARRGSDHRCRRRAGATFSAACWSQRSSTGSGSIAQPCSTNIRPCYRRWRDRKPARRDWPNDFELYACGVELANGFGELTDATEQRARLEHQMAEKERIYGERYPIDDDFLHALAGMPDACGVALGLDRLVMLVTGASRIEQVLWTPLPEP